MLCAAAVALGVACVCLELGVRRGLVCQPWGECPLARPAYRPGLFAHETAGFWHKPSNEDYDFVRHVVRTRTEASLSSGTLPTFIHVGPLTLEGWNDDVLYEDLLKVAFPKARFVFVEANPSAIPRLTERINALGFETGHMERVRIVNAALCPAKLNSTRFHVFSEKLLEAFPGLDTASLWEFSSLSRSSLEETWTSSGYRERFGYTAEQWASMLSFVEEVEVRCVTPSGLLEELHVSPAHVDGLILDAEGYDHQLLAMFLRLGGFQPALIQFEVGEPGDELAGLLPELVNRGYAVFRQIHDLLAVQAADA